MSGQRGVCLPRVSAGGGVCPGGLPRGVSAGGGVCPKISPFHTHPPVNRMTDTCENNLAATTIRMVIYAFGVFAWTPCTPNTTLRINCLRFPEMRFFTFPILATAEFYNKEWTCRSGFSVSIFLCVFYQRLL